MLLRLFLLLTANWYLWRSVNGSRRDLGPRYSPVCTYNFCQRHPNSKLPWIIDSLSTPNTEKKFQPIRTTFGCVSCLYGPFLGSTAVPDRGRALFAPLTQDRDLWIQNRFNTLYIDVRMTLKTNFGRFRVCLGGVSSEKLFSCIWTAVEPCLHL